MRNEITLTFNTLGNAIIHITRGTTNILCLDILSSLLRTDLLGGCCVEYRIVISKISFISVLFQRSNEIFKQSILRKNGKTLV